MYWKIRIKFWKVKIDCQTVLIRKTIPLSKAINEDKKHLVVNREAKWESIQGTILMQQRQIWKLLNNWWKEDNEADYQPPL